MGTERGNRSAAAAVSLTVLVGLVFFRFSVEWGQGIHLVYTAIAALAVIAMAAGSPRPDDRPQGWQSVLFVAAFVLSLLALTNVADVLGADDPPAGAAGTIVWVGLLLVMLTYWFSRGWNSGISTLLLAVTLGAVILAFVEWVFSPDDDGDTFRWILLLIALGYGAFGASRRATAPHHAVGFVNGAGLALLGLAMLVSEAGLGLFFGAIDGFGGGGGVGWGWELVILAGAAALIAYSVTAGQAGPGYLGALNLLAFVVIAFIPGEDGPSLIGWPLVFILITLGLFATRGGSGGSWSGVPARPSPEPSEPPTAVHPGS